MLLAFLRKSHQKSKINWKLKCSSKIGKSNNKKRGQGEQVKERSVQFFFEVRVWPQTFLSIMNSQGDSPLSLNSTNQHWKPLSRTPTLSQQPKPYMIFQSEEKIDVYEDDKATDIYEDEEENESTGTEVDMKKEYEEGQIVDTYLNADKQKKEELGLDTYESADQCKKDEMNQATHRRPARSATKVNYAEPSLISKLRREDSPRKTMGLKSKTTPPSSPNLRVSNVFKSARGGDIHITEEQDRLSKEILLLSVKNSSVDIHEPPKKRFKKRKIEDESSNVSNNYRAKCEIVGCRNNAAFKEKRCQKHGGRSKCKAPNCPSFAQKFGLCRLHGKEAKKLN